MSHHGRLLLLAVFSVSLSSAPLSAHQLLQPASVLPWKALHMEQKPSVEPKSATKARVVKPQLQTPAWLLETAKPLPRRADLPQVEREHYGYLGKINAAEVQQKTKAAKPRRSKSTESGETPNLFQMLGLQ